MAVGTDRSLSADEAKYGRFTRRIQAVMIDSIVMMLLFVTALFVAAAFRSDEVGRALGFSLVAILLLYEPLLVSLAGSTVGHLATNLRVVDDRSGGNVGFLKAVGRVVIKTVLGLYSFISMAITQRHQALHDVLTKSTVQIRNPAKALPHHYRAERLDLASPDLPSRTRRVVVIVLYLIVSSIGLLFVSIFGLLTFELLSANCVDNDVCSASENLLLKGLGIGWLILTAVCIIQGWRGRLWGARRARQHTP